jgi:ADP-heptose:LPS heptosyltransferase
MKTNAPQNKTIGLLTEGSLGDSLLYIPVIRFLLQRYPDAALHIFGRDPDARVNIETVFGSRFSRVRILNRRATPNKPLTNYLDLLRLVIDIRSAGVEILFDGCRLGPGRPAGLALRKRRLIATLAGAETDREAAPLLAEETAMTTGTHRPKMGLLLLRRIMQAAGVREQLPGVSHLFPVSTADREEASGWMRAHNLAEMHGTYAVGLRSKDPTRNWPTEHFLAVMTCLQKTYGLVPVFSGGPADKRMHEDLIAAVPGGYMTSGLSFGGEAALMSGCRFYLGINSGPLHLAASAGLRCIAVFRGDFPPGLWDPLGDGHQILQDRGNILPADVMAACDRVLTAGGAQTQS